MTYSHQAPEVFPVGYGGVIIPTLGIEDPRYVHPTCVTTTWATLSRTGKGKF